MGIEITILFDFNFIFEHLTDPFQTMFSRGGKKEQLNENVINWVNKKYRFSNEISKKLKMIT